MPGANINDATSRPESPRSCLLQRVLAWRFFARGENVSRNSDIIKWWEARRIPYNLIVGATGVLTLVVLIAIWAISEQMFANPVEFQDDPPFGLLFYIFPVPAYGIGANVCFTGGWAVEIFARKFWKERTGAFGEISFFLGLVFSVLLTLAPAVLSAGLLVLRMVFGRG